MKKLSVIFRFGLTNIHKSIKYLYVKLCLFSYNKLILIFTCSIKKKIATHMFYWKMIKILCTIYLFNPDYSSKKKWYKLIFCKIKNNYTYFQHDHKITPNILTNHVILKYENLSSTSRYIDVVNFVIYSF